MVIPGDLVKFRIESMGYTDLGLPVNVERDCLAILIGVLYDGEPVIGWNGTGCYVTVLISDTIIDEVPIEHIKQAFQER